MHIRLIRRLFSQREGEREEREGERESFSPRKTLCKLSLSAALGGVTAACSERERDGNATSIPLQSRISHISMYSPYCLTQVKRSLFFCLIDSRSRLSAAPLDRGTVCVVLERAFGGTSPADLLYALSVRMVWAENGASLEIDLI